MVNLTIRRKKEFNNFTQKFQLILDGQLLNEISSGQTLVVNVEENSVHQLQAKLKWCNNRTFDIKVDGDMTLEVTGSKYADVFIFSFVGLGILNLLLRKTAFHFNFLIVIFIWFTIQLYYFTVGRNKNLSIRKIDKKET